MSFLLKISDVHCLPSLPSPSFCILQQFTKYKVRDIIMNEAATLDYMPIVQATDTVKEDGKKNSLDISM